MAEQLVNIGWAGGWDEYIIDTDVTREQTPEEIESYEARVAKGWGGEPVVGNNEWLRVLFCARDMPDTPGKMLVKIVRHVRGGD